MRVGGNIWRDMIPMDPIKAEFMFTSDIINFYLWSFQHVPLPPEYNYLVKVIEMRSLSITFQKPPSFDLKDCSVRGMWTQFDHFSDLDPSFQCPISETIPDLIASQEMEWADRNLLKAQKLQEMKSSRNRYEEEKRKKELEELEAAKAGTSKKESNKPTGKKTAKKKKKKSKDKTDIKPLEAPPPVVTEQTTVDIDELYVLQEQQHYEQKMEHIGPKSLNIGNEYINLRQYTINGGVFAIHRFDKLPQPSELRGDFIYSSLPEDLKLTEKKFTCEGDTDLMVFKVTLPGQYFWWHSPVVCRWEIWEESDEFLSLNEELQKFHLDYDKIMEEKSKQLFSAPKLSKQTMKPTIISDFSITDIPIDVKIHFLIKDHVLPRIPQRFKFHAEMHKQFSIIQGLFMREQRLKIEEKLNDLLNLTFQKMKASGQSLDEQEEALRVPSNSDVPEGKESMASLDGSLVSSEVQTPMASMLEELVEAQYAPAYLFPPCRKIPFLIIAEKQQSELSDLDLDDMMQDILESVISDDDFSSESVYKLFSTFIKFLDRLRELEQPVFPEPVESEEPEADPHVTPAAKPRTVSRESTHRHPSWTDLRSGRTSRMISSFSMPGAQRPQSRNSVKLARKKRKRRKSTILQSASDASTDEEREPKAADPIELKKLAHPAGRWTTRGIHKQEYDSASRTVTIWTDKLGTFGFAMERYYNLPFKGWDMRRIGKLEALFQSRQVIEGCPEQQFETVMVNPLKVAVVTVEEACSPLDEVILAYHPTPENQSYYPDVYSLLKGNLEEPSRKLFLKTPPMLQWNVAQILQKLRLFSYS
ncbi:hypothetical protein RP20_CCG021646 [Aedes albopictus]|nr:hypothetical protein RP20_CCG021646 [Aedes albopictus]